LSNFHVSVDRLLVVVRKMMRDITHGEDAKEVRKN
jgi:hypothetical protein